jgi:ATP-dependent helicase HrpB
MAQQLGEPVGERVGYRIRGEQKLGKRTRIEVVTEGILARLIQADPELLGIGLIIFDEFHERSLHADLGLALARDVQKNWRNDLRILVMSATLNGVAISALLDNAPVVTSTGRSFPVTTVFLGSHRQTPLEPHVVQAILHAFRKHTGDLLVFLPGQREIRRTQHLLEQEPALEDSRIHALFGEAAVSQQQAALQPDAQGNRKIILSTSIAETSLTIDGVCVVIDAGLVRAVRFDPRRGMSGLVTVPVSQATAEQRSGRAGRQQPGACYRLWSTEQQGALARFPVAEVLHSDLIPLALELAVWGTAESELVFLDPPPAAHLQQAREALQQLGAVDEQHCVTAHGRAMHPLPVHPRYAHMLLRAREHGFGALACDVAALLEERDLLRGGERTVDLFARWQALQHGGAVDHGARERVRQQASRLRQMIHITQDNQHDDKLGLMLALCYPERVAKRRDTHGERWQLASGIGATLPAGNVFANTEWIAVAELDGEGRDARIFLAAALDVNDLQTFLPEMFFSGEETLWSHKEEAVLARKTTRFGAIMIEEKPLPVRGEATVTELCKGLRQLGWRALPLPAECQSWLERLRWARQKELLPDLPDCSETALLNTLEIWLAPFLGTGSETLYRRSQLTQVDWHHAVRHLLSHEKQAALEQLAPSHITVPTGSRIALNYSGEQPVLAVRLQEMFGVQHTPCIANGTVRVLIHLLSPAKQPLAVTQDLASFWQNAYKDVRKDMRGQYKRHYWPENPLDAEPTRRTKAADDRARKS